MKTLEIEKLVRQAICTILAPQKNGKVLNWKNLELTDHFYDDYEADSLSTLELVMELEDIFDIDLTSVGDFSKIDTVEDVVKVIEKIKNEQT